MPTRQKVVVVGCGFAGLSAVQVLAQFIGLKITVIDQKNHHLFQPLLYQVATGELDSGHIASPIRSLMSKYEDVTVVKSKVTNVDLKSKTVTAICGEFKYDYLVMACGALHSYFGKEEWETYAPGLKTIEQALEIKNRIFNSFERAEKESDPVKREKLLSFAIVGGGPTGVEMAGAIADVTHLILTRNFRNIDPASAKVTLIDAGPRILSAFSEKYSKKAQKYLENMGVNVLVNQRVTNIDETGVTIGKKKFEASTVIWGAGVAATEITKTLGVELDRPGRAIVERDLSLKEYPEVFVIGDQAHALDSKGNLYPGVATVALQQGFVE